MKVIIFATDADKVSVFEPPTDSSLSIEEIADQKVPPIITYEGKSKRESKRDYIILDDSELPSLSDRDQWVLRDNKVVVDFNLPTTIPQPDWDGLYES